MVFPDEQTADGFGRVAKGYADQIKEMGRKWK